MTPDQLVNALLAPPEVKYVDIALRTGLRLEQITAKLETLTRLQMDASEFYDIVEVAAGRAARRLSVAQDGPRGRAEGRLARGLPVAGDLSRPARHDAGGARPADARQVRGRTSARTGWPSPRTAGLTFYQVLTLASIVEREAQLDEEKPLIAGVYATGSTPRSGRSACSSRTRRSSTSTTRSSWPSSTVPDWTKYVFWAPIKGGLTDETLPPELAGYNTYTSQGLPPGPI